MFCHTKTGLILFANLKQDLWHLKPWKRPGGPGVRIICLRASTRTSALILHRGLECASDTSSIAKRSNQFDSIGCFIAILNGDKIKTKAYLTKFLQI